MGTHRKEDRHGRIGVDAASTLSLGERGFGYQGGEIWTCHVAWSRGHVHIAERDSAGAQLIGGDELLLPGKGHLAVGEGYISP